MIDYTFKNSYPFLYDQGIADRSSTIFTMAKGSTTPFFRGLK